MLLNKMHFLLLIYTVKDLKFIKLLSIHIS